MPLDWGRLTRVVRWVSHLVRAGLLVLECLDDADLVRFLAAVPVPKQGVRRRRSPYAEPFDAGPQQSGSDLSKSPTEPRIEEQEKQIRELKEMTVAKERTQARAIKIISDLKDLLDGSRHGKS